MGPEPEAASATGNDVAAPSTVTYFPSTRLEVAFAAAATARSANSLATIAVRDNTLSVSATIAPARRNMIM